MSLSHRFLYNTLRVLFTVYFGLSHRFLYSTLRVLFTVYFGFSHRFLFNTLRVLFTVYFGSSNMVHFKTLYFSDRSSGAEKSAVSCQKTSIFSIFKWIFQRTVFRHERAPCTIHNKLGHVGSWDRKRGLAMKKGESMQRFCRPHRSLVFDLDTMVTSPNE